MKVARVSQHKPVTADHYVIVTWRTVDHVDACFKAVCSTMQNHVNTPCIITKLVRLASQDENPVSKWTSSALSG